MTPESIASVDKPCFRNVMFDSDSDTRKSSMLVPNTVLLDMSLELSVHLVCFCYECL